MRYWNKTLRNMSEYIPGEQPQDIDSYIKLNTNENAFPPSESVIEALKKECGENLRLYPDPLSSGLITQFANMHGLKPENVFAANGSDELFTLIFRAFIDKDQRAAFNYPSYSLYYTMSEANGISYDKIPLHDDFNVNFDAFLENDYTLVIFCNPNNPTGTGIERSKLKHFMQKFKGLVVVDEAYVDFCDNSMIDLVTQHDNLIVTRSFSKSYSLAGLRVGLAAAHENIIKGFNKIKDSYNVDRLAAAGALASLKDERGLTYRTKMINNNKEYLVEALGELGFNTVPSQANFIFTKHPHVPAEELYFRLKEEKILVRYFKGDVQSEYIRITVGTMMEIKELVKKLRAMVE